MDSLRLTLLAIFHPSDMLLLVKRQRNKVKFPAILILLFLFVIVRFVYIYTVHYPLADVLPIDANLWLELAMQLIPILLWTLSVYAVTTILNGEVLLTELLTANAYCLLPYILLTVPIALLSNVMSAEEAGFYNILNGVVIVWVIILLFFTVMQLNDYSFSQTIGICILGIIAMALIACVLILLGILTLQFICFVESVITEYKIAALT